LEDPLDLVERDGLEHGPIVAARSRVRRMAEASLAEVEERVIAIARELARETGGARAALLATPTASLERDLGLGSLERVELLTRLERALGRSLDEAVLRLDTAAEIARAAFGASASETAGEQRRSAALAAAPPL